LPLPGAQARRRRRRKRIKRIRSLVIKVCHCSEAKL
jgi:hypothetical protein